MALRHAFSVRITSARDSSNTQMATVEGKDKGRLSDDEDKREERERQRGIADDDEVDLKGV